MSAGKGLLLAVALAATGAGATLPQRIVSTTPSITETLYALGAGDRVVAVTDYCHYPPEAAKKPHIGSYMQPNLELIASLKPDLVVVEKSPLRFRERLEALRAPVIEVENTSIAHIIGSIRTIGAAVGATKAAQELEARIQQELAAIRQRNAAVARQQKKPSMMFVVSRSPHTLEGIMVAGRTSYLNELIEAAGGVNTFADAPGAYPKIALEQILARSPDVIVDMGEMAETTGVTEAQRQAVEALWRKAPSIAAVRNRRVFAVAADYYVVPGPRLVEAVRQFARMLHGEADPAR